MMTMTMTMMINLLVIVVVIVIGSGEPLLLYFFSSRIKYRNLIVFQLIQVKSKLASQNLPLQRVREFISPQNTKTVYRGEH